jgi:GNAT superfamily N-acetyltransferase
MQLRKAKSSELPVIWEIIQYAIEQRRLDGSQQWQDGYPNEQTIRIDIDDQNGYVVTEGEEILAYAAILFEKEDAYEAIEGEWLSNGDYAVVHRLAASKPAKGRGVATAFFYLLEELMKERGVFSIKADTNFDNGPMLHLFEKLGYTYCGEIYFQGAPRKAYEKVLDPA